MAENHEVQAEEDGLPMDAFSIRMRNFVADDPSPRNPRFARYNSPADRIEKQMQTDGHSTWGYVIYRTTFDSDADWTEFLRRLRFQMEGVMNSCNGRDILELFTLTVFEDRSFDGANSATIRQHFQQWTETAYTNEQPSIGSGARGGVSSRYRFCVQVDAEALRSVVHGAPSPEADLVPGTGWVKLIDKSWILRSEDPIWAGRPPHPHIYEAIEGVTDEDVGWMRCPYQTAMTEWYYRMEGLNAWVSNYERPPKLVGGL